MADAQKALDAIDAQNAAALASGSSRSFDPYGGTKGVMSVTDKDGNVRSFDPYAGDSAKDTRAPVDGPLAPDAGPPSGSESGGGYGEGLGANYDKAKGGYISRYAQGGAVRHYQAGGDVVSSMAEEEQLIKALESGK